MTDICPIRIETAQMALVLFVDEAGRLFQSAFGAKESNSLDACLAYPAAGDGWIFESALQVTHADGNTSTDLRVISTSTTGNLTRIELKDPEYQFWVDILYRTFAEENVIETWTEIRHTESGPVTLDRFASSSPDFGADPSWLTQFRGDWAEEVNMSEEQLSYGIKTLDSKLGVRAHQFRAPWFLLSRGGPAQEDSGEVFAGSLAWSGSFSFAFEIDPQNRLRAICGINPYASSYDLDPAIVFTTPSMVWGWSGTGTGDLSRNLHRWVRENALRDGDRTRAILLNNWEATYFTFDEKKIVSLFDGAKSLGMELFLLDDGWFGDKYPRNDDSQGLGDWMPDVRKLPNGVGALTKAAESRGLRFGLWLEPEMVSPRSELFEKHPDWVIRQPNRPLDLQRNQLILDLSQPDVSEFVFGVADQTLRDNHGISYIKWDCNRYITQPGSVYLGPSGNSRLWVDYVRALYNIFERLARTHPNVEIMMCAGGGGRVDYGAMQYAQEFWPSDRTDPARRVFIQWGYSFFFPAISMAAHVTEDGHRPLKFCFDVAMSGRLGMDTDLDKLSSEELKFAGQAIEAYKRIRNVVQLGEQYRLESPYSGTRSAVMYRLDNRAVAFAYSLGDSPDAPLKLKGLSAEKLYKVQEINVPEGQTAIQAELTGEALMISGLPLPAYCEYQSGVFELITRL